jgi:class 3 adenylate cyclase/tetratricopeptide (TPR) repeat protein
MNCTECQQENRPGAKFCDNCGARLPRQCPACGIAVRVSAKFCDECGQALAGGNRAQAPAPEPTGAGGAAVAERLAEKALSYTPRHLAEQVLTSRAALEGERKQVTVLFVDCVGFTALSTRLDPEDIHTIMDGCFQHLLDAVHRYAGTVNQFTGDGIMALFGAPIAHEDHAVRAVAAALAIQKAVRQYADRLRQERGLEFAVRVGLNTGPVVVGKIGDDLRMDYTAQGETVNLAARLQGAAPAGDVLMSEATHRLVSGYFLTQDAGEFQLKGLDQPVRAYAVTGQRSRRARFDVAVEHGLTPLVGRARELASLRDDFARAQSGRGQTVSVVGEAGVGKSRLVYELRRQLENVPHTYLEGHGLPHGASLPFHLIAELLQASFAIEEGEPERVQVEKVAAGVCRLDPALDWTIPYLKHLLALPADELEAEGLDQAQRKQRMIEAVKALVLRAAQDRPLLILVEDLPRVDRNSEELLRSLVDCLAGYPVLLICTYRPGYTATWEDRSFHQRLALNPLSTDETADMVRALLGAAQPAPSVESLIVQRAEGNPFFAEELTRYLRERGLLGPSTSVRPEELTHGGVPDTIHALLTARIDRLREPLKYTLQLSSVLGREFPLSVLEALAPAERDLQQDLAELVRLELLHEKELFPEVRYSFTHLLIQQVAYQSLLLKSRAELHARAGAALEQLYADRTEEALEDLAEHYARSQDRAKAIHYLGRTGDRAASLFAYEEAETYYQRALGLLGEGQAAESQRTTLLDRLGDAAFARGALSEALGYWRQALPAVLARGVAPQAADLHRKIAGGYWAAGEKEQALSHLEQGLAALADDAERLEAARLYQELGRIHFHLGDHERATDWARRALALGDQLGVPDVVAHAYNTLGLALARAGDIDQGAQFVSRGLETALAHQLGAVACRAYTNLAVMYSTLDHTRSAEYSRAGLALAQQIGDQLQQAWLYCALAGGHCTLAGDYDNGIRAAQAAVELDQRLGQRNHLPIPLIILAQICQCGGDYVQSERYYREALAVAETVGEPQLLFPCYEGLATLAIENGDEDEAEAWLARSRAVQETTGWSSDVLFVLPFLC